MTRPEVARLPLLLMASATVAALIATAGRYGYHRDELYFIALGGHPAFGYVDQPPMIPLLAHAMDGVSGGSLTIFRLPSAIATGVTVFVTGLIARELGAPRSAQGLAAGCMAVGSITLAVGHLMSTATFDLLTWTVLSWLLVRAIRDDGRIWVAVGLVAGLGLQVKVLPVFLLLGVAIGILAVGRHELLRSRWMWVGAATALVVAAPSLVWQAANGWPQLELAEAIAAGSSATSEPRWAFLPYQLLLVSPLLFPIWMIGWWQLLRSPELRTWRCFAIAYVVVAAAFIWTGGKPYYLAGFFPLLLAAGSPAVVRWVRVRRTMVRRTMLGGALTLSLAASAFLFLPLVPAAQLSGTPIPDINSDAPETVGWPRFADTVAGVVARQDRRGPAPVVLTRNYGEAGAMLRFRPEVAAVHSGHNAFWMLGPPPDDTRTVVAVGLSELQLRSWFGTVERAGVIDNGVGLDNEEQGAAIWVCSSPLRPWSALWPEMRRLG